MTVAPTTHLYAYNSGSIISNATPISPKVPAQ